MKKKNTLWKIETQTLNSKTCIIYNLGSKWPGSLFRLMVNSFCQLYSPINGITCRTKYNVHTKNIIWKCLFPFINTKSEDDAHKPIVRIINQYWSNYANYISFLWKNRKYHTDISTSQNIKHVCKHLLWHQCCNYLSQWWVEFKFELT